MQNSRIECHYIDIRNFFSVVSVFMREKNLATSAQAVVKPSILYFHCQDIKYIVLILQRDFIAKERLKKSLLENNLPENQIESAGNVEEKNGSSDKIEREIKKEPYGSLFVEPYSSLN